MLLVTARVPSSPTAWTDAGRVTGLAPADIKAKLAGRLPRVLHSEADPARAAAIGAELEALGFAMIVCDPRAAPADDERLVARGLRFTAGGLQISDDAGHDEELPFAALALVQRGVRTKISTEIATTSVRKVAWGRAIISGGLLWTKKEEVRQKRTTTARDAFLLLQRSDGERDVVIYERRLDYRSVLAAGESLEPSSAANFDRLYARLRDGAGSRVTFDDRVGRPGFLSGLPVRPDAALDLALWLVQLAHLRGSL